MPFAKPPPLVSLSIAGTHRLVRCWELTGDLISTLRFTDHDHSLLIDGQTYQPSLGLSGSAISHPLGTRALNTSVRGVLSSPKITENDLRSGRYRGVRVREFLVDWRFPYAGRLRQISYKLGDVRWNGVVGFFEADLVGRVEELGQQVGEVFTRDCRWNLGDDDCGVDLDALAQVGTVTGVTDRATFTISLSPQQVDGWFDDGQATWQTGSNAGLRMITKSYRNSGSVVLQVPAPNVIQIGNQIEMRPGCNKLPGVDIDGNEVLEGHCKHKFNNLDNFGGFPFMPTNDRLLFTPDAKTE